MRRFTRLTYNGVDLSTNVVYVSLHTTLPATDENEVTSNGYARVGVGDTDGAWPTVTFTSHPYAVWRSPTSPDAMRLDASRAEADAELAEWRALLDGAKGRRRG